MIFRLVSVKKKIAHVFPFFLFENALILGKLVSPLFLTLLPHAEQTNVAIYDTGSL
jgi:hypothetical protein